MKGWGVGWGRGDRCVYALTLLDRAAKKGVAGVSHLE